MLHVFISGEAVSEKELREIAQLQEIENWDSKPINDIIITLGQLGFQITFNNSFWRF